MKKGAKVALGALDSLVPSLLLGCGLLSLGCVILAIGTPLWRVVVGIAALCLLALWWMLLRQERALREMRQLLGCFREETMTRRSTMRFIFDELLDDSDTLRAQIVRSRHELQDSLNVASGFLELLGGEISAPDQAPMSRYLTKARAAVGQATAQAATLGRKQSSTDQNLPDGEMSGKSTTVSARNRLYAE